MPSPLATPTRRSTTRCDFSRICSRSARKAHRAGATLSACRQGEVVEDADRDPDAAEYLGRAVHPVQHVKDDGEAGEREDQVSQPRARALPHDVMIGDCQMQQCEAGQRAEIDHPREIVDPMSEEEANEKRY